MSQHNCINCGYDRDLMHLVEGFDVHCRACLDGTRPISISVENMSSGEIIRSIRSVVRQVFDEHEKRADRVTRFMIDHLAYEIRPYETPIEAAVRLLEEFKGRKPNGKE